jgi:hypothetical protein
MITRLLVGMFTPAIRAKAVSPQAGFKHEMRANRAKEPVARIGG